MRWCLLEASWLFKSDRCVLISKRQNLHWAFSALFCIFRIYGSKLFIRSYSLKPDATSFLSLTTSAQKQLRTSECFRTNLSWRPGINKASDGFTHRPNRPWPRAPRFWGPRASLSYDDSILSLLYILRDLTKNLRNCAEA